MKFNHRKADAAAGTMLFVVAAGGLFALYLLAWRLVPWGAACLTLLVGIPVITGFWPDKKEKP